MMAVADQNNTTVLESNSTIPSLKSGGCRVLLISPQRWDGFHLSKHHYAAEFASFGNEVYFLNPPTLDQSYRRGEIRISPTDKTGIHTVDYKPSCPYWFKFHFRRFYNWMMKIQSRAIAKKCGGRFDFVWDFDNTYNFTNLPAFGAKFNVFHVVDKPVQGQNSSKQADAVLAVDQSILDQIEVGSRPSRVVGHGLASEYVAYAEKQLAEDKHPASQPKRVGYVGNLLSTAIDRPTIVSMVDANSDLTFEFFGPYDSPQDADSSEWIDEVRSKKNCVFHGLCSTAEILDRAPEIDIWFTCYDNSLDVNRGVNSHKMLEYLATGSPVVSSRIKAFDTADVVRMPATHDNEMLPEMMRDLVKNWAGDGQRIERIKYALSRSYRNRIETIENHLAKNIA